MLNTVAYLCAVIRLCAVRHIIRYRLPMRVACIIPVLNIALLFASTCVILLCMHANAPWLCIRAFRPFPALTTSVALNVPGLCSGPSPSQQRATRYSGREDEDTRGCAPDQSVNPQT
jgi:hypothetical protein